MDQAGRRFAASTGLRRVDAKSLERLWTGTSSSSTCCNSTPRIQTTILPGNAVVSSTTSNRLEDGLLVDWQRAPIPSFGVFCSFTKSSVFSVNRTGVGLLQRSSYFTNNRRCYLQHRYFSADKNSIGTALDKSGEVASENAESGEKKPKKKGKKSLIEEKGLDGTIPPISQAQLWAVFVASAVPFVGFGFLDNFLMILAGDVIDATLCVQFSFSTMAAAALGNTISDVAGVFSGGIVEDIAQRFGIEIPELTSEQLKSSSVKFNQYVGQAFGIVFGCFLGMCPLLWIDPNANEKKKKEKEREEVLKHVVSEVSELLNAEATLMMMVDSKAGDLYTKATEHIPEFRSDLSKGVMGQCARTGKFLNIGDVAASEFYDETRHSNYRGTGMQVRNVMCMPVMNMAPEEGDLPVLAVVEVINKKADTGFTQKDEEMLATICSHIAVSLTDDKSKSFKNVLGMCKEQIRNRQQYSTMNPVIEQRQMKLFETLMEESSSILNCEASQLLLIDPVQQKLKAKVAHRLPLREFPLEADIVGNVCSTAQLANIADITRTKFYDKSVHLNYLGSGIEVRTVLCVPVINTEHHVIGCMMAINKKSNEMFTTNDIEMFMNISSHVALTLEGEGSSIKKVLALAADQKSMMKQSTDFVRTKTLQSGPILVDIEEEDVDEEWDDDVDFEMTDDAMRDMRRHSSHRDKLLKIAKDNDLLVTLERAEHLPIADLFGTIDPYITISLVKGDPKSPKYKGPSKGAGYVSPLGWGKSSTITQNQFPEWNEKIRVKLPEVLAEGYEDVYIHVKLWDWDFMKSDDMIGEMVYPLKRVLQEQAMVITAFPLTPIRGNPDEYDLKKAKLHIKFTIAKKEKGGDLMTKARKQQADRGYYESNVDG